MNLYVADTHALFWYFIASPLLGAQAQAAFDEGKQGQALIYIPAIVLAELYFLNEKKQRPIDYSATFALLIQSAAFQRRNCENQTNLLASRRNTLSP